MIPLSRIINQTSTKMHNPRTCQATQTLRWLSLRALQRLPKVRMWMRVVITRGKWKNQVRTPIRQSPLPSQKTKTTSRARLIRRLKLQRAIWVGWVYFSVFRTPIPHHVKFPKSVLFTNFDGTRSERYYHHQFHPMHQPQLRGSIHHLRNHFKHSTLSLIQSSSHHLFTLIQKVFVESTMAKPITLCACGVDLMTREVMHQKADGWTG